MIVLYKLYLESADMAAVFKKKLRSICNAITVCAGPLQIISATQIALQILSATRLLFVHVRCRIFCNALLFVYVRCREILQRSFQRSKFVADIFCNALCVVVFHQRVGVSYYTATSYALQISATQR